MAGSKGFFSCCSALENALVSNGVRLHHTRPLLGVVNEFVSVNIPLLSHLLIAGKSDGYKRARSSSSDAAQSDLPAICTNAFRASRSKPKRVQAERKGEVGKACCYEMQNTAVDVY